MDDLVYEILWKLEEVKRTKKAKAFFEELSVLEEAANQGSIAIDEGKIAGGNCSRRQNHFERNFAFHCN